LENQRVPILQGQAIFQREPLGAMGRQHLPFLPIEQARENSNPAGFEMLC